jgi:hypothetical protein
MSCRQIAMSIFGGALARVTVLSSDRGGTDIVTVIEIGNDLSTEIHETKMPHRNGRLVASDETVIWQAPDGQIFAGEMFPDDPTIQ